MSKQSHNFKMFLTKKKYQVLPPMENSIFLESEEFLIKRGLKV